MIPRRTNGYFSVLQEWVPQAALNIFGLQAQVSLDFAQQMIEAMECSCIFVRDSGNESALV